MAPITVSNKDVEVLSEALFCYYFAIKLKNKSRDYDPKVWDTITNSASLSKWTRDLSIYTIVALVNSDSAFTSRLSKVSTFLNEKGWHDRLNAQVKEFTRKYSFIGNYMAMRADEIPAVYDPYRVYDTISTKAKTAYGFKGKVDKDKWNPSDVWIFSPRSIPVLKKYVSNLNNQILKNKEYCVGYLNAMNNKIYDLFKKKSLYPVSLKAPGASVNIVEENVRFPSYQKIVRFTQLKYENNNQDAKIGFAVDIYDKKTKKIDKKDYIVGNIKTKTVKSGGARLEIEVKGGGARYGSMGTENYQWIINETDNSGIKSLSALRNKHPALSKYWSGSGGKNWLGRKQFVQQFNKDPQAFAEEIKPYTQTLYRHLNKMPWDPAYAERNSKSPEEAWLNKTHAGEVGVAVNDITNKIKRDITVENLVDLSASQRFSSGIRPNQIEARKNTLSKSLGEELEAIPPSEAKTIWNASFYLVVK